MTSTPNIVDSTICDFSKSFGSYRADSEDQVISLLPMQWKIAFAIIHCNFSLHSASRGEEETDLQQALQFPTTSERAIFGWFCSVTQTLKHIHAERQHKLAKSQSSKSTWHGAALRRAGLAAWLQTWDTHVGLALPLAGSLNSQLQAGIASAGPEQALPKLRDAVAEQTLLNRAHQLHSHWQPPLPLR